MFARNSEAVATDFLKNLEDMFLYTCIVLHIDICVCVRFLILAVYALFVLQKKSYHLNNNLLT